ncbi:MAG: hypothetical protein AB2653_17340 [Candidatus Thiodiazotropha endolucinida]|nr:hypothetical protein [Candidatus Thiodiazotropha endolucinida]
MGGQIITEARPYESDRMIQNLIINGQLNGLAVIGISNTASSAA